MLHFDFCIHLCRPTCIRLQRYLNQDSAASTCHDLGLSVANISDSGDNDHQQENDRRPNMSSLIETPNTVPFTMLPAPSHPAQAVQDAEKPAKRKANRKPNYSYIHRNPLPLEIYPLPV